MSDNERELRRAANMILYHLCKRDLIRLNGKTLAEMDTVRNEARQVVYEGLLSVRPADPSRAPEDHKEVK